MSENNCVSGFKRTQMADHFLEMPKLRSLICLFTGLLIGTPCINLSFLILQNKLEVSEGVQKETPEKLNFHFFWITQMK